jgi:hypothetical protein
MEARTSPESQEERIGSGEGIRGSSLSWDTFSLSSLGPLGMVGGQSRRERERERRGLFRRGK